MQLTGQSIAIKSAVGHALRRASPIKRQQGIYKVQALFGWGGNKEEQEWKRQDKEEQFRAQQEILKRRRDNTWQKDVDARRSLVKRYGKDPEYKKKVDEEKRERAKAERAADPPVTLFDIILPVAPFGIPEYDLGERFDLKAKYAEKGWVDEDAEFGKQVARFFGGLGGKKKPADEAEGKGSGKTKKKR